MTETRPSSSTELRRGSAIDFALRRLARRAHSEKEISLKLERAGYPAAEIEAAVAALRERRYLDDGAYAVSFVRSACRKHWGPARIERALGERGVAPERVRAALAEAFPDGEAGALGRAFARWSEREGSRGEPSRRRARAYRHLVSRGFSPEAVRGVLERKTV